MSSVAAAAPRPQGDSHGSNNETVVARRFASRPIRTLRERQLALMVLCVGTLVIVLDGSVVNVALPSMRHDLGFSQSDAAWVVNAYLIPFGGLLLLSGRLGDLVGPKRLFVGGLALFTVASVACGLSQDQATLIAGRAAQGVGGALASAVVLGMIWSMFPNPREQVKAIGFYAFVAASGSAVGLLAGAVLTQTLSWHWIFFVNVPIGVATIAIGLRLLDDEKDPTRQGGADVTGAVLVTASLMVWVYAIVQVAENGWGSARTLGLAAVALALLVGFVVRQARARNPLVPLKIFRARNVAWINVVQSLMVAGPAGMFFLGALYMQQVLRYSPLSVGLAFLPVAVAIAAVSLKLVPRMLERADAKLVVIAGLALMTGGLLWFARAPVDAAYVIDILPAMLLIGVGAGMAFPGAVTVAMADATLSDRGLRSGLVATAQQVGPALGLAALAAISTERTSNLLAAGDGTATALADGYHLAFLIGAGFVVAALILSVTVLKPAVSDTAPDELDAAAIDEETFEHDLTGVLDPDFLAIGLGATNSMAMLWSVAMGKRSVGVELRGDPYVFAMHWNVRERLYDHFCLIDQMMLERYGADRLPRVAGGERLLLADIFHHAQGKSGDARADEVIAGFAPQSQIAGLVRAREYIDDRFVDGAPRRTIAREGAAVQPAFGPRDPRVLDEDLRDVLEGPTHFQVGSEELLILMRRYLEAIEQIDLEAGCEPRVRLFTYHRVLPSRGRSASRLSSLLGRREHAQQGYVDAPGGRKRIRIEAVRELDEKRGYRRIRRPGSEVVDIGVPELFVVATGEESSDARQLGFEQEAVTIDRGDGRGLVSAQADYLIGEIEVFVDSRVRRRIASEFDKQGNEYWVRQVATGHEDDPEIGWFLIEVPDYKTFDPIRAGVTPAGTERGSSEYYSGFQFLLHDYFREQVSQLTEIPKSEVRRIQLAFGPKLITVAEKLGVDAQVCANGVIAGDSFGNGSYLESGGVNTGIMGHAKRVLRYWQARADGVEHEVAIRALADAIKQDTMVWQDLSAADFSQPPRAPAPAGAAARHARRARHQDAIIETTRRHRRSISPPDFPDDWSRFVTYVGELHAYELPPLQQTHPATRRPAHLAQSPPAPASDGERAPEHLDVPLAGAALTMTTSK